MSFRKVLLENDIKKNYQIFFKKKLKDPVYAKQFALNPKDNQKAIDETIDMFVEMAATIDLLPNLVKTAPSGVPVHFHLLI